MTLKRFLGIIDISYEKVPEGYELFDNQGTYELENDDDEEYWDTSIYRDIPSVVDRVSGIYYDWIMEDLEYEFGCEEEFDGDFESMLDWIEDNKDEIYPEDYAWFTQAIKCILNPSLVTE